MELEYLLNCPVRGPREDRRDARHGKLFYTDGIKYFLEWATCYWLIDLVATCQRELTHSHVQHWHVSAQSDRSAIVTATGSHAPQATYRDVVRHANLPLRVFVAVVTDQVMTLPSEQRTVIEAGLRPRLHAWPP